MLACLYSLGAGLLVGLIYAVLGVRSPAPPAIALIGLLGILIGEQILPIAMKFYPVLGSFNLTVPTKAEPSDPTTDF